MTAAEQEIGHVVLERHDNPLALQIGKRADRAGRRNDLKQAVGQDVGEPDAQAAIVQVGRDIARHHHRLHAA